MSRHPLNSSRGPMSLMGNRLQDSLPSLGKYLSPFPHIDSSDEELGTANFDHSRVRLEMSRDDRRATSDISVPSLEENAESLFRSEERLQDRPMSNLGSEARVESYRQGVGDMTVPSVEEIIARRAKMEKKLEVQDWLTKSDFGGEMHDDPFLMPYSSSVQTPAVTHILHKGSLATNPSSSVGILPSSSRQIKYEQHNQGMVALWLRDYQLGCKD